MRRFAEARKAAVCVLVFDRVRDLALSRAVAASCGGRVVSADSPGDLLALAGTMDLVLGVRLHALVFAAAQGTPAVGLAYDSKVSAFMREQGLPGVLPVRTSVSVLEGALADAWDARADLRARLIRGLPEWRRAAAAGVRLAIETLPPA
jgi:polysaccharide pyruvyl transferase WcaK-like protein